MKSIRAFAVGAAWVLAAFAAAAQQPRITNAKAETHAVSGTLDATVSSIQGEAGSQAVWVGYETPMIPARSGHRQMCCGQNFVNGHLVDCGGCSLETNRGSNVTESDGPDSRAGISGGTVKLEGPDSMFVLLRIADHRIGLVRTFTEDCELDAGGLRFVWLTGVKPAESVALMTKIVTSGSFDDGDERRAAEGATLAVALSSDPSADKALESFVAPERPEKMRSNTAFWLGNARGAAGLTLLKRMAKSDPSPKVREQVTFALSQSHEPGAVDEMIRMAKEDESRQVRGQALFWLAQKAGQKALGAITDAIQNDPDTDIKKKAVFALSQLPKDEGVPKLIEVARTNKNVEVRKQAMFWLGQSNDPRALAFFQEVLTR
ncbi:MAG TPA: HEAT repeat domain-containing protein [Candidatus Acidoferrales bacterium]|nr:HEAT repeat domain-containing protein [Candidatus Acidoferrales bacterium]